MQTSEITLEHPAGRVRVQVPTDVRLRELMPDVLDVADQPDRDDWALGATDGPPYAPDLTLAQLGVSEGSVLVLRSANGDDPGSLPDTAASPSDDAAAPPPPQLNAPASPRPGSDEHAALRPVSARTARTLPERPSTARRLAAAGRALVTGTPRRAREPRSRPTGVPDPALFALPRASRRSSGCAQAWLPATTSVSSTPLVAPRLRRC